MASRPVARPQAVSVVAAAAVDTASEAVAHLRFARGSPLKV